MDATPVLAGADPSLSDILNTHDPESTRQVDLRQLVVVIESILQNVATNADSRVTSIDNMIDNLKNFEGMPQALDDIRSVTCEMSFNPLGSTEVTMVLLKKLKNYSWNAKVVLAIAAFASNIAELSMLVHHRATDPIAMSVDLLKGQSLKLDFTVPKQLLKDMLEVAKANFEFLVPPISKIPQGAPPMKEAMEYFPIATYRILLNLVEIATILSKREENIDLTIGTMASEVSQINTDFQQKLEECMSFEILKTHDSKCIRQVDLTHLVQVIESILQNVAPDAAASRVTFSTDMDNIIDNLKNFEGMPQALDDIHSITREMCNSLGSIDIDATAMVLLKRLRNYSWNAKVVLAIAAFALSVGELFLVNHRATNPIANSVDLKSLRLLTHLLLKVVNANFAFLVPPVSEIPQDAPLIKEAMTYFPLATYRMIFILVQIASILSKREQDIYLIRRLATEVSQINTVLEQKLAICKRVLTVRHPFHEHTLVLVHQEQSNQNKPYCSGCDKEVLGSCFGCAKCNYHLHKECAEAPRDINNHPLHRMHSRLYLRERPERDTEYACAFCNEKRNVFFYGCGDCWFSLDINCALFVEKVGENFYQSKDNAHQYPFKFISEHRKVTLKRITCTWCHEPLVGSMYISVDYKFYFHERCFRLPTKIDHPLHPIHTLILEFDVENHCCKLCQKEYGKHFFYHCSDCNFDIHLECISPRPIIEGGRYHKHPFSPLWRRHSFTCDGCGTDGKFLSYICSTCHLQVHENCASLPCTIKISRHGHPLFHRFFFGKKALDKHQCGFCFEELKTEYGSYHCSDKDCNYVVHVNCAIGDSSLYEVIDQDQIQENFAEDMESSITVIEENKHGEATEIKHFIHQHDLVLEETIIMKAGDSHSCHGCVLPISTPFFYCLQCDFILHKACAKLPKTKHHWYHRFLTNLKSGGIFKCSLCEHHCSGFFYESRFNYELLKFCLRCTTVPYNIEIECGRHKHFLLFDSTCKEQCNGCGGSSNYGAFRCKGCNFTLDFACITLPLEVQHKCDEHLLELTYHEENDDPNQIYCHICETKRDPKLWYYHCSTCDNSSHSLCVLGKYPFIKSGSTFLSRHRHTMSFVRQIYEYPECCYKCGNHCEDLFLKCTTCQYIEHYSECPSSMSSIDFW